MKRTFNMKTLLVILALLMPTSAIAWGEGNMAESLGHSRHFNIDGNFVSFCMEMSEQAVFLYRHRGRMTDQEQYAMIISNVPKVRNYKLAWEIIDFINKQSGNGYDGYVSSEAGKLCIEYAREQEFRN